MRLFGWDQISEIVQNAEYTAPSAARYIVSDCGNPQCSGIYEYKQQHKHMPREVRLVEHTSIRVKVRNSRPYHAIV